LGKSNGIPKREVDLAFGNSSAGWSTGILGVDDESAGMVSSVSGGCGKLVCSVTGFDRFLASLILPCSDETRGGGGILP
jgi:hypothetical protein